MAGLPAAFFLACSWFWCIGGFFPVLLQQEFGAIAFPVFLVFNVAGAALFGFIWSNAGRAGFLQRHGRSAQFFSVLVVGYHLVFMAWISVLLHSALPLLAFIAVTMTLYTLRQRLTLLAAPVFGVTVLLFVLAISAPLPQPTAGAAATVPFLHQILPLALGFLLAPCFDLTFHRAFAASSDPRQSFMVGFALLFTALLGGMYLAMPVFSQLLTASGLTGTGLHAVVLILALQTGFTTAAHLRELSETFWSDRHRALPVILIALLTGGLLLATDLVRPEMTFTLGALVYRGFVFMIGALFPVILLFGGWNRQALLAMVLLTPCYTLGFLIGGEWAPFLSVAMAILAVLYWVQGRAPARRQHGETATEKAIETGPEQESRS